MKDPVNAIAPRVDIVANLSLCNQNVIRIIKGVARDKPYQTRATIYAKLLSTFRHMYVCLYVLRSLSMNSDLVIGDKLLWHAYSFHDGSYISVFSRYTGLIFIDFCMVLDTFHHQGPYMKLGECGSEVTKLRLNLRSIVLWTDAEWISACNMMTRMDLQATAYFWMIKNKHFKRRISVK